MEIAHSHNSLEHSASYPQGIYPAFPSGFVAAQNSYSQTAKQSKTASPFQH